MSVEDTVRYKAFSLKKQTETEILDLGRFGEHHIKCDRTKSRKEFKLSHQMIV